jgi:hypothetical protein
VNTCLQPECAAVQMVRRSKRVRRTDSVLTTTAPAKNPLSKFWLEIHLTGDPDLQSGIACERDSRDKSPIFLTPARAKEYRAAPLEHDHFPSLHGSLTDV